MTNGIDVSKHNGVIDWQRVRASGKVDFAILRAGLGRLASQKDAQFERNYAEAKAQGIPLGAYWYSYALTPAEAVAEARAFLEVIAGKQFEYPVWFDIEEQNALATGRKNVSAIIKAFCGEMEQAGYWCGIYASRSHLESYVDAETQKRYALWVAEWGNTLHFSGDAGMWQLSSRGQIDGISGYVDLDRAFVAYPEAIRKEGKNGFSVPDPTPAAELTGTLEIGGRRYSVALKEIATEA